jgi:nucleotide-binding universal stress UspA family protein
MAADRAGDYVASIAIRFHAKVTILHAFLVMPVSTANMPVPPLNSYTLQKDAEGLAEKTADRLRNLGVQEVESEVIVGQPANVILGVAESIQPDMIILGARGLSTWKGLLLGSVSSSIVQRAEIPVLVVK